VAISASSSPTTRAYWQLLVIARCPYSRRSDPRAGAYRKRARARQAREMYERNLGLFEERGANAWYCG
jgi:hypothetical protein